MIRLVQAHPIAAATRIAICLGLAALTVGGSCPSGGAGGGPTADAGGASVKGADIQLYGVDEGLPLTLDASGSQPGAAPIVSYQWDLDGDAVFEIETAEPVHELVVRDELFGNATLRVVDAEGRVGEASAGLIVREVRPSLVAVGSTETVVGQPVDLTLAIYEPGDDPVLLTVRYGDGESFEAELPADQTHHGVPLEHAFATPGDYEIQIELATPGDDEPSEVSALPVSVAPEVAAAELEVSFEPELVLLDDSASFGLTMAAGERPLSQFSIEVESVDERSPAFEEVAASSGEGAWTVAREVTESGLLIRLQPPTREMTLPPGGVLTLTGLAGVVEGEPLVTRWTVRGTPAAGGATAISEAWLAVAQRDFVGWGEDIEDFCALYLTRTRRRWLPRNSNRATHVAIVFSLTRHPIDFQLTDVSTEPGHALNEPQAGANRDPDLIFRQADQHRLTRVNGTASASTVRPVRIAAIRTRSRDFGAYGSLVATSCDGQASFSRSLPRDDDGNHIADAWDDLYPGDTRVNADSDAAPVGLGRVGDGLSRYEEYRGFYIAGRHTRTDPTHKDVFVRDELGVGIGNFATLNYVVHHRIREAEIGAGTRQIDFNQQTAATTVQGTQQQFAILLAYGPMVVLTGGAPASTQANAPFNRRWWPTDAPRCYVDGLSVGAAPGDPLPPLIAPLVVPQRGAGVTRQQALDWVIGHELGHAVGLDPPPATHAHVPWKGCTMNARLPIAPPPAQAVPGGYCAANVGADTFQCQSQHAARGPEFF